MAIKTRGNSFQAIFSIGGRRYRRSFPSADEARIWEEEVRTRIARGETVNPRQKPSPPSTLNSLFKSTHDRWWKGTKAEATAVTNAQDAITFFGADRRFNTITTKDLDRYISALKERGLSGGTINRRLAALGKMLNHAKDMRWIAHALKMPRQRECDHHSLREITAEEESRVLGYFEHTGQPEMRDLVILLIDTGLRLSEALALRWIDLVDDQVSVSKSKTPKGVRSIPMSERVKEMIRGRRADQDLPSQPDDSLWPTIDVAAVEYYWGRMRQVLGFEVDAQFTIAALRDTFGVRLVRAGAPLRQVQEFMGHKRSATTLRYAFAHNYDANQNCPEH